MDTINRLSDSNTLAALGLTQDLTDQMMPVAFTSEQIQQMLDSDEATAKITNTLNVVTVVGATTVFACGAWVLWQVAKNIAADTQRKDAATKNEADALAVAKEALKNIVNPAGEAKANDAA